MFIFCCIIVMTLFGDTVQNDNSNQCTLRWIHLKLVDVQDTNPVTQVFNRVHVMQVGAVPSLCEMLLMFLLSFVGVGMLLLLLLMLLLLLLLLLLMVVLLFLMSVILLVSFLLLILL